MIASLAVLEGPLSALLAARTPAFLLIQTVIQTLMLIMVLTGCDSGSISEVSEIPLPGLAMREVGDLPAIVDRGALRIVRPRWQGFDTLPRQGIPVERYHLLAERFADSLGLRPEWIIVDRFDRMFPALLEGQADLVAANVTVTGTRARNVEFSVPLTSVGEWVLTRNGVMLETVDDLARLSIGIPAHASYLESLLDYEGLAALAPIVLPAGTTPDEVAARLRAGQFDATLMDDNTARSILETHDDLQRALILPVRRSLAWAVRPDNHMLRARLDDFITASLVSATRNAKDRRDLTGIKHTGRLRMLTTDGPATYYLWRGELMGFDYELLRDFADSEGLELEVVVAPDVGLLIPWLLEGRGDVAAAALTITPQRRAQGVEFTRPYLQVEQVLVSRAGHRLSDLSALAGRTVSLNPATAFWNTASSLQEQYGFDLAPVAAPVDQLIAGVENGRFEVTVADSHLAGIEAVFRSGIEVGASLDAADGLGWAVHGEHPELLGALNEYLKRVDRGTRFNVIRDKYFRDFERAGQLREYRVVDGRLSPYDDLVRGAAEQHSFDWRLIVAQMYQESQFNPASTSRAGALGLMQMVPRTARELGVDPVRLKDPVTGIDAGVRYLAWSRERFAHTLPADQRMWFTLAAYNAGVGHVRDARLLARQLGNDPDVWFGSVDQAMLLLGQKKYARRARHGWVRGSEPVQYVAEIRRRYHAYLDHFDSLAAVPEGYGE